MCVNIFNIFLHVVAFARNGIKYCLTEITCKLLYLFIVNLESCRIIILYLMLFVGKGLFSYYRGLSVYTLKLLISNVLHFC
jgi:hypothetical protein